MRNRRGISTMVGAVFFIIAMTVAISYISFSMDTLDQFVQTVVVKSSVKEDKINEDFEVSKLTITPNNEFDITVTNVGQVPLNITRLWVENVTSGVSATDAIPKSCDIKQNIGPQQIVKNIGLSCATITAYDTASYQMKLVTERGTTLDFTTNAPGKEKLLVSFVAVPDSIPSTFTTTLFLQIVNNASSHETIHNIKPVVTWTSSDPNPTILKTITDPLSELSDSLKYGDTATFKWVYKVEALAGESVTFFMDLTGDTNNLNDKNAIVSIENVLFAQSSKSALESEGLACCQTKPEILVFHYETRDTPKGEYQMASMDADLTGKDIILYWDNSTLGNPYDAGLADDVEQVRFITNNDTETIETYYGAWNITLRYWSEPLPHDVYYKLEKTNEISVANPLFKIKEMMIHHFDKTDPEVDSGYGNCVKDTCMDYAGGLLIGDYDSTGGPHGSGVYYFSNGRHLSNEDGVDGNIKADGDDGAATALWFKIDSTGTPGTDLTLYSAVKDDDEYYKIFIDGTSGNLVFDFSDAGEGQTTCTYGINFKSAAYIDNWHHLVANMAKKKDECTLYVNGTLAVTGNDPGGNELKAGATAVRIGAGDSGALGFHGWIDDVIHWKKNFGTKTNPAIEALALYKTNFGNASTVLFYNITKTDVDGNHLAWINHTMAHNVTLPFSDPKGGQGTYEILKPNPPGGTHNYTFYPMSGSNVVFNPHERLKVDLLHDPAAESSTFTNLPIILHIDDNQLASEVVSFIQLFGANSTFPAYLVYDNQIPLTFQISNIGPDGIWLTFSGARVVFEPINPQTSPFYSYAAFLHSVNATTTPTDPVYDLSETKDSLYIDALTGIAYLEFFEPREIPEAATYKYSGADQDCGLIPPGAYKMAVNIVGYDELGANLFRTFNVGKVQVFGDNTQPSCET